ncbi:MAG: polysaccharide biosynthesis tyrosine autokinase [Marinilabiliaceae bacterium]|nr:polysaccharide biosynthesis tyrosine autokinase [Marinilabiliaceae bacterium]
MSEFEDKAFKQIDIKKLLFRAVKYWYILPIFLIISISVSLYYFKTTVPTYKISSKLLISGGESSMPTIGSGSSSGERGPLPGVYLGEQNNIENQLIILTSYSQIEKTLKQLDFDISYYRIGTFLTIDIYKNSPFTVLKDTSDFGAYNWLFEVEFISKDEYILTIEGNNEFKEKHSFFEKVKNDKFSFSIVPNEKNIEKIKYIGNKFGFAINNKAGLIMHYSNAVMMKPLEGSTIFELSVIENNVQKGIDFLNALSQNSVNYTLDKKNQIAINTINFIEKQLIGVSDSLSSAEKVLEDFRSRHEVMDVSMQGQMIIEQSQDLENQRAAVMVRLDYYNYLIDYIESNRNVQDIMVPSSMGVEDPALTALISELGTMNAEKSSLQFNSSSANPNIARIDRRLEAIKNSIIENTKNNIETTNLTLKDLDRRLLSLSGQIRRLPKTEQVLLGIERKFQMSNEMYTYLLERRSEAQLAKAANLPDNEIVESAHVLYQVEPNLQRIIFMLMFFGFFVPSVIIFLLVFYNGKINDKEDVENITDIPILGQVPHNKKAIDSRFVSFHPRSSMAEAFRAIRTSLGFYDLDHSPSKVILVTSIIPGEGKSFCSTNIAATHALMGKKTLLLGYDLRKPGLGKYFSSNVKETGVVNYYVSEKAELFIEKTEIDSLDVLFAGEIPPNPAELIASYKTNFLFEKLRSEYDVIVIDTPPIGIVSDAYMLTKYSDVNIIVVRHGYTPKLLFGQVMRDEKHRKMKNIAVIVNGMPYKGQGYSLMYGYGKDYYTTG